MRDQNLIEMFKAGSKIDTVSDSFERLIRESAAHVNGELILECMDDLKDLKDTSELLLSMGDLSGETN